MKVLICFDVDGTLETSNGPVKLERLEQLRKTRDTAVCVVSPSSHWPIGRFPYRTGKASRHGNLEDAVKWVYPEAQLKLYVSDNKDYDEARAAGFTYIEASQFT